MPEITHNGRLTGEYYHITDLLSEIEKDAAFFKRSDGGVTVGGGEPAVQAEFVGTFLQQCRQRHIHTVLETNGLASWKKMARVIEASDLIYFDLKHMNDAAHKRRTGASNKTILENIVKAAADHRVVLRIPIVNGFNDTDENLAETADFAKRLGLGMHGVQLLPFYHADMGLNGHSDQEDVLRNIDPRQEPGMCRIRDKLASFGLAVRIGE